MRMCTARRKQDEKPFTLCKSQMVVSSRHQHSSLSEPATTTTTKKAHDSRALEILCKTGKKMQLRLTLSDPLQRHMDERLNKTHSSIPAVVCFHTSHPATAPRVCSCERESHPGSFTSTGSLSWINAGVPHPPLHLSSSSVGAEHLHPLPGSPPSAIRQRCCKWRDKRAREVCGGV